MGTPARARVLRLHIGLLGLAVVTVLVYGEVSNSEPEGWGGYCVQTPGFNPQHTHMH
jgi:hypothetical protein